MPHSHALTRATVAPRDRLEGGKLQKLIETLKSQKISPVPVIKRVGHTSSNTLVFVELDFFLDGATRCCCRFLPTSVRITLERVRRWFVLLRVEGQGTIKRHGW